MYNALEQIPGIKKLVQVGIRDYCEEELDYIKNSNGRVTTFFDKEIKERLFEVDTWKQIVDEIIGGYIFYCGATSVKNFAHPYFILRP